jgi:hypothetical protein
MCVDLTIKKLLADYTLPDNPCITPGPLACNIPSPAQTLCHRGPVIHPYSLCDSGGHFGKCTVSANKQQTGLLAASPTRQLQSNPTTTAEVHVQSFSNLLFGQLDSRSDTMAVHTVHCWQQLRRTQSGWEITCQARRELRVSLSATHSHQLTAPHLLQSYAA